MGSPRDITTAAKPTMFPSMGGSFGDSVRSALSSLQGTWTGSGKFRLFQSDPEDDGPAGCDLGILALRLTLYVQYFPVHAGFPENAPWCAASTPCRVVRPTRMMP